MRKKFNFQKVCQIYETGQKDKSNKRYDKKSAKYIHSN